MIFFPKTSKIVRALSSKFEGHNNNNITINFAYSLSKKGIFKSHIDAFNSNPNINEMFYVRSYSEFEFDKIKKIWKEKFSLRPYVFFKTFAYRRHLQFCKQNSIKPSFFVLGVVYEVGAWESILKKISSKKNLKINRSLLSKKIFISSMHQINDNIKKINNLNDYDKFIGEFVSLREFLHLNEITYEISDKSYYSILEKTIKFINIFDFDILLKVLGKVIPFIYILRELINE